MCLVLAGCANQYQYMVNGTISKYEGDSVYLKVFANDGLSTLDRGRVMHGKFSFHGAIDSMMFANLFLDNNSLIPFVLEDGDITLRIDENICTAEGTPLNDSLSTFIRQYIRIETEFNTLPQIEAQMLKSGMSVSETREAQLEQLVLLQRKRDELVNNFIRRNYNNVLGPGVFRIMTSEMPQPCLNPLIERITEGAPPCFLNDPYVKEFLIKASQNPF